MSARGKFISLEGGEGVGKSTQTHALASYLQSVGIDVVFTREPGGSPGAEAIRKLLLEGEVDRWTPETEAMLFAAARADHVARVIKPALDHGHWVVCDRFVDSTIAYQGGAGGVSVQSLVDLHRIGTGGLMPDRTLLLNMPMYDAAWREFDRDQGHLDRFARKSGDYHVALWEAFAALANADPQRITVIDASGTPAEVTQRVISSIQDLLP